MKYLLISAFLLTISASAFANVDRQALGLSPDGEVAQIQAKGLVCDFCAQAIQKMFGSHQTVQAVNIDLSSKLIHVNFKPGATMSDDKITEVVEDAGYNVAAIERFKS